MEWDLKTSEIHKISVRMKKLVIEYRWKVPLCRQTISLRDLRVFLSFSYSGADRVGPFFSLQLHGQNPPHIHVPASTQTILLKSLQPPETGRTQLHQQNSENRRT